MEPLIDVKRSALINLKRDPSQRNKTVLRAARNKAQQTTLHCAKYYWLQLCQSIQTSPDTGNIRGIKKATCPTIKKTAPLKTKSGEFMTHSNKQMEIWVEHYLELYSTENTITDEALSIYHWEPACYDRTRHRTNRGRSWQRNWFTHQW